MNELLDRVFANPLNVVDASPVHAAEPLRDETVAAKLR